MNKHVAQYYTRGTHFHDVICLSETSETLESAQEKAPDLPKGWFELARLPIEDRIEFVKSFWTVKLPFAPHFNRFLETFFEALEAIEIFLLQEEVGDPYQSEMVYSLRDEGGFFHGSPPASMEQIEALQAEFSSCQLPEDYVAFLQIHDGFCKANDTGIIPVDGVPMAYEELQTLLSESPPLELSGKEGIHTQCLLPFYQSFGLSSYQCFYADWYPEQEMGNLYYSAAEHHISDYRQKAKSGENLAFPTFLEWLLFYLETIDLHS